MKKTIAFLVTIFVLLFTLSVVAETPEYKGLTQNEIESGLAGPARNAQSFNAQNSADTTGKGLADLRSKFPHGKYWNGGNANQYTSSPCSCHGWCTWDNPGNCNSYDNAIQCLGFVFKLANEVYGGSARNWSQLTGSSGINYVRNDLKAGDIVRYGNHSVFIVGVSGNTVSVGECNYGGACLGRVDTTTKTC